MSSGLDITRQKVNDVIELLQGENNYEFIEIHAD